MMIELFKRARWDQAYDFLTYGDPPMIARLLAINTIFFVIYIIRKTRIDHQLRQSTLIQVQAFLLLANILILFQRDIMHLIDRII